MSGGGVGGIVAAGLGLVVLQVVTSSDHASSGFAALLQLPGQFAQSWTDPTKPLIPQTSAGAALSSSLTSTGAGAPIQPVINAALNPPGLKNPPANGGKKKKG